MTTYDIVPKEVLDLIKQTTEEYHEELHEADVTVDAVFAFNESGDYPVKFGGYPALAVIKINSLKNRIKGAMDAEITIDRDAYNAMNQLQRIALIDHELHHLIIARDKEDNVKLDDAERPKLKIRKHDYQMGWFRDIALRHKENSPEVYQAQMQWQADAKTFFPKVTDKPQNEQKAHSET